ncbi:sigma 54-interacting transcriptional regulator [Buttiauxella selenatireducens]|uniref:Sigma 54-interacting transcriptional regulator n=1 Tax=Buttiauxella selenatireducens TaxID=3073902 RepID=A0ABY9SGG3_9ENTR|nr:sigma 54-interacting transcriptional regulator [Buttiauxella sp. R73]WMY76592.1 sigma 54-interacting transcriptional regulator [Buttiauxella sp. R73]
MSEKKAAHKNMGTLMRVQPTVAHFTQLLHRVLLLEVEVIDNHFVRVAGTGIYGSGLGEIPETNNQLLRSVIETGKEKVVLHSKLDPLCSECKGRDGCHELAFIGVPVLHDNVCLGVISLIATNQDQHQRLCDNSQMFIQYIKHISTLVINNLAKTNVINESDTRLFSRLIMAMDQGVVVLDDKNRVVRCNENALKYLAITEEHLVGREMDLQPLTSSLNAEFDYVQYRLQCNQLHKTVTCQLHLIENHRLLLFAFHQSHLKDNENEQNKETNIEHVIGDSCQMQVVKRLITQVANSPSSIMVTGESGTGKEVVARAIHRLSPRQANPFIAINCAAIPENLLESELFGYTKGAFTGAAPGGKIGLIQSANGGTLFLDEIGDMPLILQAKLLRVLETRELQPVGSSQYIKVDIRVISATNQKLDQKIQDGQFREDLFYRLNVIPVPLPPLRERRGDIEMLMHFFLNLHTQRIGRAYPGVSEEVINAFLHYRWPGNVRELSNLMEYLVNIVPTGSVIDRAMLPPSFHSAPVRLPAHTHNQENTASNGANLKSIEKTLIEEALIRQTNKRLIAEELGIGIATLYRKIKKYGLEALDAKSNSL